MPTTVRRAALQDLPALARMANLLNVLEGKDPAAFTEDHLADVLFGPNPATEAFVAEAGEGRDIVGYAFFHDGYNSEQAARGIWLVDLFVDEPWRGKGYGRALMAAVARETLARGAVSFWWGVMEDNVRARDFYARLGARDDNARILEIDGEALARLAEESS